MGRSKKLDHPTDDAGLAKLAIWEADRTLDREAAAAMRALADRFKLASTAHLLSRIATE
jgi:hypothetical protein